MKPALRVVTVAVLGLVLLASLIVMSNATENSERFGELYSGLAVLNAFGLCLFLGLIARKVYKLYTDLRAKRAGARLRLRFLILFVGLSLIPVVVVYGFSVDFLNRGIDSWFDVRVARALEDALELSRDAFDQRMRKLLKQTEQLATELMEGPVSVTPLDLRELRDPSSTVLADPALPMSLDALRTKTGADELLLLTRKGGIIALSSSAHEVVPNLPGETILLQLRQGRSYIGLDPINDATLAVRVVVDVPELGAAGDPALLQALYPVSPRVSQLADNVQSAYLKYRELTYLRDELKLSFTMTLTLVLAFSVLASVWAAFFSATRLAAPIHDLAAGTRAVAGGDYGRELPVTSQDDLGVLVESFNEMSRKIARARDESRQIRDQVEAQRAYLEAVLSRLSSGVLTLDPDHHLRTANPSAGRILGVDLEPCLGQAFDTIAGRLAYLEPFAELIRARTLGGSTPAVDWREQLRLFGPNGRQELMCRGTTLGTPGPLPAGHVIVFDDITALIQGQREAAWSEAARRLAHEIKNPLTPIQLSAERLRHKYLPILDPRDAGVLDRLTHTIVQQVETLKLMVNSFSEYARSPQLQPKDLDLNQLIEEVLELYQGVRHGARIETDLDPLIPVIQADPGRLRQVLHNLIRNAIEATGEETPVQLRVSTRCLEEGYHCFLEVRIADHGRGIPPTLLERLFEPYVTNKPKGTGLGLAIVKKIVDEHGGVVWLENNAEGGATAVIRLPVPANAYTERTPTARQRQAL